MFSLHHSAIYFARIQKWDILSIYICLDVYIQEQKHGRALSFWVLSGAMLFSALWKPHSAGLSDFPSDQHPQATVWVIMVTTVAKEVMWAGGPALVFGTHRMLFAGLGAAHWGVCIAELCKRASQLPSLLGRCGHRLRLSVFLLLCLTTQKSNSLQWKFHWKYSFLFINWSYPRLLLKVKMIQVDLKKLITQLYHLYNNCLHLENVL